MLQVCDAKTLKPKRLLTYAVIDKELEGNGICAHPPKDRRRNTQYNYIIDSTGTVFVFALDTGSSPAKLLWKTPILKEPAYAHSLGLTEKFVVFVRQVSTAVVADGIMQVNKLAHIHRYSEPDIVVYGHDKYPREFGNAVFLAG